jgi:hypothetical protein
MYISSYKEKPPARNAIRHGWLAGLLSLLYTIFAVIFNEYSNHIYFQYLQAPDEFLVIAVLTWLMFLNKRIGMALMVIYFTTHKLILFLSGLYHSTSIIIVNLVLLYIYISAAKATFLLDKSK